MLHPEHFIMSGVSLNALNGFSKTENAVLCDLWKLLVKVSKRPTSDVTWPFSARLLNLYQYASRHQSVYMNSLLKALCCVQ